MAIFHHVDRDGDELEVHVIGEDDRDYPGTLMFGNTGRLDDTGTKVSSSLDRDAALRLHAALGEWLYPVHTPEWANKSLIEQMIERAVKDQVAAVLPLHLSTVATCGEDQCDKAKHLEDRPAVWPDPEPHDVGHAEEPTDHGRLMAELPRRTRPRPICVSCGHGWGEHTGGICWGDSESDCSCTRERPGTTGTS